jgi:hypothetical protein
VRIVGRVRAGGAIGRGSDERGAQPRIAGGIKPQMAGDLAQIGVLGRAQPAIGQSDIKQPAEQILENCPMAGASSPGGTWNTSRKAATSSRVTVPSALAILAPRAMTAIVKAMLSRGSRVRAAVAPPSRRVHRAGR